MTRASAARTFLPEPIILLGISKRGDRYLRTLLIHSARSALRCAPRKRVRRNLQIGAVRDRRAPNIAAVALANKNSRGAAGFAHALKRTTCPPPPDRRGAGKNLPKVANAR